MQIDFKESTSQTLFNITKEISKFVWRWDTGTISYFLDFGQRFWWWIGHSYNITLAIYLVGKTTQDFYCFSISNYLPSINQNY